MMKLLAALTLAAGASTSAADPLACQPNAEFPMLCVPRARAAQFFSAVSPDSPTDCSALRSSARSPIFHLIGNVTKDSTGSIKLEPINDASGVTYKDGIYHAWHQCCQNHWCVVGRTTTAAPFACCLWR